MKGAVAPVKKIHYCWYLWGTRVSAFLTVFLKNRFYKLSFLFYY